MVKDETENLKLLKELITNTGDTYAFNGETSVKTIEVLLAVIKDMGLDPGKTEELRKGLI